MLEDCEVYIYHPCLLSRAQNSQPWSSCGLPSVRSSLPFGLRDLRQINPAIVLAQLAPQIHRTFSPVSRLGTRRCTADSDPAIPSAVALGQKGRTSSYGFSVGLALRQVGTMIPLSPSLGLSRRAETTLLRSFDCGQMTPSGQCSSRTNLFPGFNRTPLPVSQLSKKSSQRGLNPYLQIESLAT